MKCILSLVGISVTLVHSRYCVHLGKHIVGHAGQVLPSADEEPDAAGLPKECDQEICQLEYFHVAERHGASCGGSVDEKTLKR